MTTIILAPSADLARKAIADDTVVVTVEAEYGAFVAEGTVYTAAHHQPAGSPFAGRHVGGNRPSPCNDTSIPVVEDGIVLVSHVDLDTFGGCLRALGRTELFRPEFQGFWDLAEFVDTRGPHKLGQSGAEMVDLSRLHAFWAWSKTDVPRFPRDSMSNVTVLVRSAGDALQRIFAGDPEELAAGEALRASEEDLNIRTFVRHDENVIVRRAKTPADFCNHLYVPPGGGPAKAVACWNLATGAVTVSLADPIPGVSCRGIVQALWGPEAGGHDGIAGSPRERRMSEDDLHSVVEVLNAAIRA